MFEFAWPWVFLLLPLPWVMRRLLPAADRRQPALKVAHLEELRALQERRSPRRLPDWRRQAPYWCVWALLLLAAARPQWLGDPVPLPASGRDLLLAVDVSGSMDYPDMRWNDQDISRLGLVKQLFGRFIDSRRGDRVGLILFGSQAYLQAPLTFDLRTVSSFLRETPIGIAGTTTAIGDAIGLAVKRLRLRPHTSRTLVLVTDGASNAGSISPLTAARLAAEEHIRIYTIGIGAAPRDDNDPQRLGSDYDLDEATLQGIAVRTGGAYFRARDQAELRRITATLEALEPVTQAATSARPATPLHPWPLGLALLASLALCSRRLGLLAWRREAAR